MTKPPNILWFCTDQQRFDTIGALGNPHVSTPTIDALVRTGMAFTHAFCQSPICTPSRAAFLTGMYPSAVHVNGNGNDYFPADVPLVPKLLADAGYTCGLIGKLHLASAFHDVEKRARMTATRPSSTATPRATTGRKATTTPTGSAAKAPSWAS